EDFRAVLPSAGSSLHPAGVAGGNGPAAAGGDGLAYNLGNFLLPLVLPKSVKHWTLTTLREKLIKIGAKVVSHAKDIVFQPAEVAVQRKLFATILERIGRLRRAFAAPDTWVRTSSPCVQGATGGPISLVSNGAAFCAVVSGRDGAGARGAGWGKS